MSSLAEWRAAQVASETLPSGLPVTLRRRITLLDAVAGGAIPEPLFAQVDALLNQQQGPAVIEVKDFPAYAEAIDAVVRAVVVAPPLADVADDDHLSLSELSFEDRLWIFTWTQGGAAQVATFPEPARGRTARGRGGLRPAPERAPSGLVAGLADRPDDALGGDAGAPAGAGAARPDARLSL